MMRTIKRYSKGAPFDLSQAAVLAVLLSASLTTFASPAFAQQGTFVFTTGSLNTARENQTATLLNDGMVLIAGGTNGLELTSAELYDPATETFTVTGSLNTARYGHTATLLNNGKVLVAGGLVQTDPIGPTNASAEVYDPASGTFTVTGSLNTARYQHTATLLNNGMVLIAGGVNAYEQAPIASAELYDPATGTFASTGGLNTARTNATANLLNNGMVLIAGGLGSQGLLASAELYDPTTGTFTATGSLDGVSPLVTTPGRESATGNLLNNGMVLVAGGLGPYAGNAGGEVQIAGADLYDPAAETFTVTGSLNAARTWHTGTLLNNGMVLIVGGLGAGVALASAELYDPATGTFTTAGTLNTARLNHTATLLNNGLVLVVGGNNNLLASAELYEQVGVSPSSLSFANQTTGTASPSQKVIVTNNQSTPLSITGVAISGANGSDFAETNNCVGSLAAGASCSINVTFTPLATGARTASLTIANNLSVSPVLLPLTGTGVAPAPVVSLSSNGVAFATQALGTTSAPQTVSLRNTGTATLSIQTVAITGANPGDFAITNGSTCTNGANVAINGSCTIQLTFTPTGPGARNATVSITDNAADSPETISLSGTTAPSVSVAPSTVTFSSQYVGTSGLPQTVTVTNTGTASVTVTAVTASTTDFGVLSNCTNVVAAGANCTIGVFFDPTAGGTRTGTLSITDNAAGSPQTITLTGSGEDFSMTPGPAASATVTPGQSASYSIAIAPAGGFAQTVALSCSGGPAQSTCTVSPNSIALSGKSATTAMVTVTTMASAQGPMLPRGTGWPMQYRQTPLILALIWMSLLMAALLSLSRREQRFRWAPTFALAVLVCLGMTLTSCGGGSGGGGGTNPQAGTYTITVTGNFSSGSTTLTHAAKVTLVVQ
jgi:hypothetical protein